MLGLIDAPVMLVPISMRLAVPPAAPSRSLCREYIRRFLEGIAEVHASAVDRKSPDFLGMLAAAHLQDHEATVHGLLLLDIPQQNDRIGPPGTWQG